MRAWQCVEAQPLNRDGVMLAYGLGEDGRLKHISQVDNGLACQCTCPACGAPLIARHCQEMRDHFAHLSNKGCRYAQESVLHFLAKELLNEHRYLNLPPIVAKYESEKRVHHKGGRYEFDDAVLEKRLPGVVPDVVVRCQGRELLVEIRVTHKCGPEKIEKIRAMGLSAIEIDLSHLDSSAPDRELVWKELSSGARRDWLNNPRQNEAQRALAEQVEQQKAEEAARENVRINRRLDYMRQEAARPPARSDAEDCVMISKVREADLGAHIGVPIDGDCCFRVERAMWQGCIVHWLVLECVDDWRLRHAYVEDILHSFGEHDLIRAAFENLGRYMEKELRRRDPTFRSPHEVVSDYLRLLAQRDVLKNSDRIWQISLSIKEKLKEQKRRLEQRRTRRDDILRRGMAVMAGRGFDVRRWFVRPIRGHGVSFAQVIREDNDWLFWDLERKLAAIEAMVGGYGPPVDDLLGLPLEDVRAERARKIEEEKERKRLEEIAKEQRAAEARAIAFRQEAEATLRYDDGGWIDAPCRELESRVPLEVVRESEGGYARALRAARNERSARERQMEDDRIAAEFLAKLREHAWRTYRREDMVELFLKSPQPKLRGRNPSIYCRNSATYRECVDLLPRRAAR